MRKLTIALLIAGVALVGGCGGGGGGGGGKGGTTAGETIVKGRVMDNRSTPLPVAGVVITLGTLTQTTGSDGRFSFDLGNDVVVSSLFADPGAALFKVSTHLLPPDQYDDFPVTYDNGTGPQSYDQALDGTGASIPLPFPSLNVHGTTFDLGTVTVKWIDPSNPPPPPF